jgi:hypothetical protein
MAQSHLHQSVLPAKPQADTGAYINGLLDELRKHIDGLPIVPGQAVPVDCRKILELRGVFMEMSGAVRNTLKWAR